MRNRTRGKRRQTLVKVAVVLGRGEKKRIVEGYGGCWEKISTYEKCGRITHLKRFGVKKFRKDAEKEKQGVLGVSGVLQ